MTKPIMYCKKCGMGFRLRKLSPTKTDVLVNLDKHRCEGKK